MSARLEQSVNKVGKAVHVLVDELAKVELTEAAIEKAFAYLGSQLTAAKRKALLNMLPTSFSLDAPVPELPGETALPTSVPSVPRERIAGEKKKAPPIDDDIDFIDDFVSQI